MCCDVDSNCDTKTIYRKMTPFSIFINIIKQKGYDLSLITIILNSKHNNWHNVNLQLERKSFKDILSLLHTARNYTYKMYDDLKKERMQWVQEICK